MKKQEQTKISPKAVEKLREKTENKQYSHEIINKNEDKTSKIRK